MTVGLHTTQIAEVARDRWFREYARFRLKGVRFGVLAPTAAARWMAQSLYPVGEAVGLYSSLDDVDKAACERLVVCADQFDHGAIAALYKARAALPDMEVASHAQMRLQFDYLYDTLEASRLYQTTTEDLLGGYFSFAKDRAAVVESKSIRALRLISLNGKKAVELGCLHCGMTNFFLKDSPKELVSVEIDHANIAIHHAWSTACGHDNARLVVKDFHVFDEPCDVMLAYGVLCHSGHPLALLEHLTRLSDVMCVGAHVWSDAETLETIALPWRDRSYQAMVTAEYRNATGGLCAHQTYLRCEDYYDALYRLGFETQELSRTKRPGGRVYAEFIARRM